MEQLHEIWRPVLGVDLHEGGMDVLDKGRRQSIGDAAHDQQLRVRSMSKTFLWSYCDRWTSRNRVRKALRSSIFLRSLCVICATSANSCSGGWPRRKLVDFDRRPGKRLMSSRGSRDPDVKYLMALSKFKSENSTNPAFCSMERYICRIKGMEFSSS